MKLSKIFLLAGAVLAFASCSENGESIRGAGVLFFHNEGVTDRKSYYIHLCNLRF